MSNETPDPKSNPENSGEESKDTQRKPLSFKLKPSLDKPEAEKKDAQAPAEKPEMKTAEPVKAAQSEEDKKSASDAPRPLPKLPKRPPAFSGQKEEDVAADSKSEEGPDVKGPEASSPSPTPPVAAKADVPAEPVDAVASEKSAGQEPKAAEADKPKSVKPSMKKPVIRPAVGKSSSGKPSVNRPVINKPIVRPSAGGLKKKTVGATASKPESVTKASSDSPEKSSPSLLAVGVDAIAAGVAITFFVLALLELTSL